MNASELRVGNWISSYIFMDARPVFYGNKEISKKKVTADDIKFIADNFMATYEGIKITPEILEKCGFYKGEHHMAGEIHIIDIMKSAHRTMFITHDPSPLAVLCEENNGEIALDFIKYLHELQNLYYCLTGKELEINL
jgi:hypothetical protein